jgi:serine phosphatase RsbU (regulator of sigma subunit)/anti-sigma regulatory factor (Ser/Thr protein kinase)/anti-anti-sigma regulatory factor
VTDPGRESAQAIGFEQSPDLQLVTGGEDLRILACNASLRGLVGGRDVTGETMADALGGVLGDPVLELFSETFRTGETHHLDGWQVHAPHSGEWTHADLTISPWRDENGQVAGCIGRGSDVAAHPPLQEASTQYSAAMDLVTNLQDALLPVALPVAPALDIAATYLLATDDARAGGDWFDAIVRADGTVALVVGDTVGQGVQASAVMGQLRAVLHGRLLTDEPISESLRSLDRYARLRPESHAATVCVVVVDPASGAIEYCTAGHPPPLVVESDGSTRFLAPSGAGPLTTESDYPTRRGLIGVDDLVLLYTDGLTERPGLSPAEGADDVARAAAWAAVTAEDRGEPPERRSTRVCERTLEVLTRRAGYSDDITLLAAHRTAPFPAYRTTIASSPDSVRRAREELDSWLASLQVALLDEFAVLHAVGELITNAVEHAYIEDEQSFAAVELYAAVDPDGSLVCTVADQGTWKEATPHPDRGRGLGMVSGLVDHLTIDRTETGTTARFRKRLTRTAEVLTGVQAPATEGGTEQVPFGTSVQGDVMTVRGPLDLSTADSFRASLRRFSRGGTAEVTVDLTRVTHLGSAGVQVLHEVRSLDGRPLHLRAPTGSVAQHVLELVQLPYDGADGTEPPLRDE